MEDRDKVKALIKRDEAVLAELKKERDPWDTLNLKATELLLPGYGQYLVRQNAKKKLPGRYEGIVDNAGPLALEYAAAGLYAGLTNPAKQWFELGSFDPDRNKWGPWREWFEIFGRVLFKGLGMTNFYTAMKTSYLHDLGFGTSCILVEPDYEKVVRYLVLDYGAYWVTLDAKGVPCALYREIWWTPEQIASEFGVDNVSKSVKDGLKNNSQSRHLIIHVIDRNRDRDPERLDNRNMPWNSRHYEAGNHEGRYLRQSGFRYRPFIHARWGGPDHNPYGEAQSYQVLGNLQLLRELNLGQIKGLHYQNDPPMIMPESWRDKRVGRLPGQFSFGETNRENYIGPLYTVQPDVTGVTMSMKDRREIIRQGFYNDLFFALTHGTVDSATEAVQLQEEQLLLSGPNVDRECSEKFDGLLDITQEIYYRRGLLPPPPEELAGEVLNIEYTSRLAMALQAFQTRPIEQAVAFYERLIQLDPETLDGIDLDETGRLYSDHIGAPVKMFRDADTVTQRRQIRAQQREQTEQMQGGLAQIQAMKGLSEIKIGQGSALDSLEAADAA